MTSDLIRNLPFKLRRSAGVAVTPHVHRMIATGNKARDARDWPAAAGAYRAALDTDPSLSHVWVQLGHALKEQRDLDAAQAAYQIAADAAPEDADPWLHLGHLHKERGDRAAANRSYMQALRHEPGHPDALREIAQLVGNGDGAQMRALIAALDQGAEGGESDGAPDAREAERSLRQIDAFLRTLPAQDRNVASDQVQALIQLVRGAGQALPVPEASEDAAATPALVFDVSDLISYFRNARLPTGIQRVQIETIGSALRIDGFRVQICAFIESRDDWLEIPAASFVALARLSLTGGDRDAPEWIGALARLHLRLATAEPIEMPRGAYLINLGTSWWLQNYFLFVRQAKALRGVRYVPFVHDLIPVMAGEHCVKELTQDFVSWAIGAFAHADHFLVNSESTRRDLLHVAGILGHAIDPTDIAVVRLDADCRKPDLVPAPVRDLSRWGLKPNGFVLFVSTIESRKNHLLAFEAWIALLKRHGSSAMPKLVCVGNRGWLNDAVYARLESHAGLREHVVMLSGLSDAELELLYRACLFTIYPSRYEGWGLPVTEALCHGKIALISDASSLPEAGGTHAVYFRSGDAEAFTEALDRLVRDHGYRDALQRRIAAEFAPRAWSDVANDMADAALGWHARDPETQASIPVARLGAWHPLKRNYATTIWPGMRSAEIFRAGDGWWGPDNWGCWTKPQGGRLEIGTDAPGVPIRLYLQLHGIPRRELRFTIDTGNPAIDIEGELKPGEFKWLMMTLVPDSTGVLRLEIGSSTSIDLGEVTEGGDPRVVSVGVAGFFLCLEDDAPARLAFVEALTLGTLADLEFGGRAPGSTEYRRPGEAGAKPPATQG
ncbi:glycosyltransferase [Sphingomonas sp. KR3-1]|uniref:glycosyltransferase family 4 protein n=1 Tax=Sphingomonas sp. KR3-1 TaxID=3156611 RepID=UPI0032B5FA0D